MRSYLVTFHKIVPDDTGHDHCILQRQTIVSATSEVAAGWQAKAMFCEAMGIVDWRMRADSCDVSEIAEQAA